MHSERLFRASISRPCQHGDGMFKWPDGRSLGCLGRSQDLRAVLMSVISLIRHKEQGHLRLDSCKTSSVRSTRYAGQWRHGKQHGLGWPGIQV